MGAPADTDRTASAGSGRRGLGWTFTVLLVFVALIAGFSLLVIARMQSVARATDLQAFQRLAISAQSFATWPGVAEEVGRRSLPIRNAAGETPSGEAIHPQFGRLPLRYYWGDASGCRDLFANLPASSPSLALKGPQAEVGGGATPAPSKSDARGGADLHFGPRGLIVWGRSMTYDPQRGALASEAVDVAALTHQASQTDLSGSNRPAEDQQIAPDAHYVCYYFGPIPYQNVLVVPEGFSSLLLFDDPSPGTGKASQLVAHVGADILPIRDTSDIPDLQRLLHRAAAETKPGDNPASAQYLASVAGAVLGEDRGEFLTPLDITIAGRAYRLYVYPISFTLGGETRRMLVVGATPTRSAMLPADLNGPRFALFGLLLIALLALTPMIRIANLGPVDGIKPFELLVTACLLAIGTAVAATIVFLAGYTVRSKEHVDSALRSQASELASKVGTEIFDISTCPLGAVGNAVTEAAQAPQTPPLVFRRAAWTHPCGKSPQWAEFGKGPQIAHPDIVLFVDRNGLPPWTAEAGPVPIVTFTKRPGPFYRIGDREYVSRAVDQDVVPGTEMLAYTLTRNLGLASPRAGERMIGRKPEPGGACNGVRCGIAIEQILSRADGIAKTMLSLPLSPPPGSCEAGGRDGLLCKTGTRGLAIAFVMKSLLAPPLPDGMRFAVVDLSQRPDLPSIFHSDPERANAERFSLSLGRRTLAKFEEAIRRNPPPCAARGERRLPGARLFSGSYIGEDQRFAVALVPCTEWAVVTFSPEARSDSLGAFPAEIAFLSWLGLAIPAGALFAVAYLIARRVVPIRLRMLWPDPLLEEAYRTIALWLGGFIALVGLACAIGIPSGILLLLIPLACIGSIAFLFRSSLGSDGESRRRHELREHHQLPTLGRRTEVAYTIALGLWLIAAAALPVTVIAIDARHYSRHIDRAKSAQDAFVAARKLERSLALIYASQFAGETVSPLPRMAPLAPPPPLAISAGAFDYTAQFLCVLGRGPCPPDAPQNSAAKPELAPFPTPLVAERTDGGPYSILFYVGWIVLAVMASLLPVAMIRILCRTLFGFGVPLEAVRYPRIRPGPDRGLLYSDASADNVVWDARYPGSIVATSEADLAALRMHRAEGQDRSILRIHEADCTPEALEKLLAAAIFEQDALRVEEEKTLERELNLKREPREADYFRIVLVRPSSARLDALTADDPPSSELPAWTRFLAGFRDEDSPPYDENHAPGRAILVAGPDDFVRRLLAYAGPRTIDLYEVSRTKDDREIDFEEIRRNHLPAASGAGSPLPLVIVDNLEFVLQDEAARGRVLKLLEDLVREQKRLASGTPNERERAFRLLMLADMSPLDRFLQATERREAGESKVPENLTESIRWSRLLEDFTTYTGRVTPRTPSTPAGEEGRPLDPSIRYLLRELAYLPDRVVQALLPDHDDVLHESEIQEWGQFLKGTRPAAIADFLASQLIEHYHYLWSISSRAEQILIHRMASGELPIVRTAYALRSLVRRGIVVLDPAPRLMNDSFAQFVRGVERPELLRRWKRDAPQGGWTRIHGNLTIVLPLILLLGAVLVMQGVIGLEAALPLIAAASSAVLRPMLAGQRPAA